MEILGVVVILAVLTVVTMPLFTSFSRTSSRRAAINLVHSALDQARSLAVSTSATHYVVLANGDAGWPESCRYRAFAIFRESYNADTNHYDRLPIGPWTELPVGIAFKPDGYSRTGEAGLSVFSGRSETFYCQPAETELQAVFFKFNSIGTLDEPTDPKLARVRFFEGAISAAGRPVPTNDVDAAREDLLVVSTVTGRATRAEPEDQTPPQ